MKIYYEQVPDNYIGDYPSITITYRKCDVAEVEGIALHLGDKKNPFTVSQYNKQNQTVQVLKSTLI